MVSARSSDQLGQRQRRGRADRGSSTRFGGSPRGPRSQGVVVSLVWPPQEPVGTIPGRLPAMSCFLSQARNIGSEFKHFDRLGARQAIALGPSRSPESIQ